MIHKTRNDKIFDTLNTVILSLILIVVLYPLVFVLSASISNPLLVIRGEVLLFPKDMTLQAYARVFRDGEVLGGFMNTLLYASTGTLINLAMTTMGAYPLSRPNLQGRKVIMLVILMTMFFNGGLIPTYMVVKSIGIINTYWAMVLPGAISVFHLIVMRTFFENIPQELHEAAVIDGSSQIRTLWSVVLPLSLPIMAVMTLFYGVFHWNSFFNGLIYLSDQSKYPLQLIMRDILINSQMQDMMNLADESAVQQQLMGESIKYALIVVTSLPVLALYPLLQRYFVQGVMIGAIKG
ncbi:carbohydrate ABC transporter permease [Paenibacillus arenilitoris]|uniref:Carbohydrate ABC transporter permease n=1 Tax=Paenibacillus arenilitoris TaxID=2772299 RepID=A0A927H8M0_9BACL|nr:carbohydrate ABC transporter permease [Paenibacillus arenilitoris]MBD2871712.1 carbohydrate ABC transporter permease [Paenibacillus arenilitoris]